MRMGLRNEELSTVNRVILYLKVMTLSDIMDASGTHMNKEWHQRGETNIVEQDRLAQGRRTLRRDDQSHEKMLKQNVQKEQ